MIVYINYASRKFIRSRFSCKMNGRHFYLWRQQEVLRHATFAYCLYYQLKYFSFIDRIHALQ